MKAIETVYKGYRMRSRLEARWAIFFDKLGITWTYEQEGFEMDGERYLPDFWLPDQKAWFEVKGQALTEKEEVKCRKFAEEQKLFVSVGGIPLPDEDMCNTIYGDTGDGWIDGYQWVECPFCNTFEICIYGLSIDMSCCVCWTESVNWIWVNDAMKKLNDVEKVNFVGRRLAYWGDTPRLMFAYTAARQARFEHGEKP